jgi:phage tail protein X
VQPARASRGAVSRRVGIPWEFAPQTHTALSMHTKHLSQLALLFGLGLGACHHSGGGGAAVTSTFLAAGPAAADPVYSTGSGSLALELPGIAGDLVFVAGGQLAEHSNGRATLTGVVRSASQPERALLVNLTLFGRMDPGEPGHGAESPDKKLLPAAYKENGGPIDSATWRYYGDAHGTLRGLDALAGARINVSKEPASAFQLGVGANNRNLANGACATLVFQATAQPALGPALPTSTLEGILYAELRESQLACGTEAIADRQYYTGAFGALLLPGIGEDFVLESGGQLVERSDGGARLTGVVARLSEPAQRFAVDLALSKRIGPGLKAPSGSPSKLLTPAAYAAAGGPADTTTWHYYREVEGLLRGLGPWQGALLSLSRSGPALQLGLGANNRNIEYGASGRVSATVLQQPATGPLLEITGIGELALDLREDCSQHADEVAVDLNYSSWSTNHAFWLPGIGQDFAFIAGGRLVEHQGGSARLSGVIARETEPEQRFFVDLVFRGRVSPGEGGHAPAGSPKLDLFPEAYVAGGGPVDPASWHYYAETDGFLIGLEDLAGARVRLGRMGPAFQIGLGASGSSLEYGASGWLTVEVLAQPAAGPALPWFPDDGDVNLVLDNGCRIYASGALGDPALGAQGEHALKLPGIGEDFVFDTRGRFLEHQDGTAQLTGVVARISDPTQRFALDVRFDGLALPSTPFHPPAGSPKLELPAFVYAPSGEPIDVLTWRYYRSTHGELTGLGSLAGARVAIERTGPAFQVGLGASGKNLRFGASGSLEVEVLEQPSSGPALAPSSHGDINVDLFDCP